MATDSNETNLKPEPVKKAEGEEDVDDDKVSEEDIAHVAGNSAFIPLH